MATAKRRRTGRSTPAGLQERDVRWRGASRPRSRSAKAPGKGSRVGDGLVKAFEEMGAHLRGEIEIEAHDVPP